MVTTNQWSFCQNMTEDFLSIFKRYITTANRQTAHLGILRHSAPSDSGFS